LAGRPEAAGVAEIEEGDGSRFDGPATLDCVTAKWHQLSRFDRHMCAHDPEPRQGACADSDAGAPRFNPAGEEGALLPRGVGGEEPAREPEGNAKGRKSRGCKPKCVMRMGEDAGPGRQSQKKRGAGGGAAVIAVDATRGPTGHGLQRARRSCGSNRRHEPSCALDERGAAAGGRGAWPTVMVVPARLPAAV
jgi:hypothetical protein